MKIIENYKEFDTIASEQGRGEVLYNAQEVNCEIKKIDGLYTVFSIQDSNDGEPAYLVKGFRIVNNIGYYVFAGEYELKNEYIEL